MVNSDFSYRVSVNARSLDKFGLILWGLSHFTSIYRDKYHIIYPNLLDPLHWLCHRFNHEKRSISKTTGLEIESQAETTSVARRAANRQDFHIKSVWPQ